MPTAKSRLMTPIKTLARPGQLPSGIVVYAVGDIHGRLDLLDRALAFIEADFSRSGGGKAGLLIFLGDYVDRGPDSRGVIERLLTLDIHDLSIVALKGNHELMMVETLEDPSMAPLWAIHGGATTIASYGVSLPADEADPKAWIKAASALQQAVPKQHIEFLEGLKTGMVVGDYFFVHAGVRPDRTLDRQAATDLLWIRDRFLNHEGGFEKIIVHGHSTATEPLLGHGRIGIDTGAHASGLLTVLKLDLGRETLFRISLEDDTVWS